MNDDIDPTEQEILTDPTVQEILRTLTEDGGWAVAAFTLDGVVMVRAERKQGAWFVGAEGRGPTLAAALTQLSWRAALSPAYLRFTPVPTEHTAIIVNETLADLAEELPDES